MEYLNSDKKIREDIVSQLKVIGEENDPLIYRNKVAKLFQLTEKTPTKDSLFYLGGFVNGEGSVNVSIKSQKNLKFGVAIDPEFSITQSVTGVSMLFFALRYFQTGRISYKGESKATLVYRISNRASIKEKIIPFYTNYMKAYCPVSLQERYTVFFKLLDCFDRDEHLNIESFEKKVLPLWERLRVQDTIKTKFKTADQVMKHVRPIWEKNKKFYS